MGMGSSPVTRDAFVGPSRRRADAFYDAFGQHERRWKAVWREHLPTCTAVEAGRLADEAVGPFPTWEDFPLEWFLMGPDRDPDNPFPDRQPRNGSPGTRGPWRA